MATNRLPAASRKRHENSTIYLEIGERPKPMSNAGENMTPISDELWMSRFNGIGKYALETAEWNVYEDSDREKVNLWLRVECGEAIEETEDTSFYAGSSHWELNLVEDDLGEEFLVPGFEASIPIGYDESRGGWVTNFYFSSHEGSDNNTIKIIKREGDRLLIRISGDIKDVNYYDGSKPKSVLILQTWFTKSHGKRTMS